MSLLPPDDEIFQHALEAWKRKRTAEREEALKKQEVFAVEDRKRRHDRFVNSDPDEPMKLYTLRAPMDVRAEIKREAIRKGCQKRFNKSEREDKPPFLFPK